MTIQNAKFYADSKDQAMRCITALPIQGQQLFQR